MHFSDFLSTINGVDLQVKEPQVEGTVLRCSHTKLLLHI